MEYKPTITLAFPDNRIQINMSSLRALQYPHYVRLLINPVQKTIALQISDRDDPRCHRMVGKYRNGKDRIDLNSKELMEKLMLCGEWDVSKRYRIEGMIHPGEGMIVYSLFEAIAIGLQNTSEVEMESHE